MGRKAQPASVNAAKGNPGKRSRPRPSTAKGAKGEPSTAKPEATHQGQDLRREELLAGTAPNDFLVYFECARKMRVDVLDS